MSLGGGGSTQEQSSTPSDINFLNPIGAVIANMFGIPVSLTPEGGMKLGGGSTTRGKDVPKSAMELFSSSPGGMFLSGGSSTLMKDKNYGGRSSGSGGGSGGSGGFGGGSQDYFAERVFGPGSFEPIANILNAENIFASDVPQLGRMGSEFSKGAIGDIDSVMGGLLDLPERVGKPIDMGPIISRVSTDLAEQFAASGGFSGSDFENAAMRAGSELAVGEEQDALGRLMEATLGAAPLVGSLGQTGADLGMRGASNLLGLGEQYNLSSATPQGRATTLLQLLAGVTPTGAVPRGNYSQGSSKGGNASVGLPAGFA